jgi:restriction endonuclease S subunit
MWKISAEDIWNFPIPIPPVNIQSKIVLQVKEKREEIAHEREAAERKSREIKEEIEALISGTKKIKE